MTKEEKDRELKRLAFILASHVDNLQRLAATWGNEISSIFEDTKERILSLIESAIIEFSENEKLSSRRVKILKQLKSRINDIRYGCTERAIELLEKDLSLLIKNEDKWNRAWLLAMFPLSDVSDKENIKSSDIKSISDTKMEDIRKNGIYNGDTVKGIFQKIADMDVSRIVSAAFTDMMKYGNTENAMTLKQIRANVSKSLEKTIKQIEINITGIVNGISNDSSASFADRNKAAVNGVMWITALDDRVCEECASLEGVTFFPASSAPVCPAHYNCRCHLIPVAKGVEI